MRSRTTTCRTTSIRLGGSTSRPHATEVLRRLWTVAMLVFGAAAPAVAAEPGKPLDVLYVTGGCCHDYDAQKELIVRGMAARARIRTTVVHEGGTATNHPISIYAKPDWAKGYDVVFHNECFSDVKDPAFLERILAEHKKGVPAVLMHCAMHCYRTGNDEWFKFCGITSPGHGAHYPYTCRLLGDHPVLAGMPREWAVPKEELYYSDTVWPTATPLGEALSTDRNALQTCIWTNRYGSTRVFATTIGHYAETVATEEFLGLVTRGTLWAAGKLRDDGSPVPELALESTGVGR
ncbi:MAG: ThuA domain-containing protein [Planctomycetaceae bacterium]